MTKHKAKRAISVLHDVSFLKSATNETNFPPATVPEIAIIGRSNAGKSSILNTICGRKKLALVSKTPGKTQLINFFSIKHNQIEVARIVDLPGYGYARVNKSTKSFWNKELLKFLKKRENLIGIILVTDIRHALGKLDKKIFFSLDRSKIFYHVLFNKSDKLNKSEQKKNILSALTSFFLVLPKYKEKISQSMFSAVKKEGAEELLLKLELWLDSNSN